MNKIFKLIKRTITHKTVIRTINNNRISTIKTIMISKVKLNIISKIMILNMTIINTIIINIRTTNINSHIKIIMNHNKITEIHKIINNTKKIIQITKIKISKIIKTRTLLSMGLSRIKTTKIKMNTKTKVMIPQTFFGEYFNLISL